MNTCKTCKYWMKYEERYKPIKTAEGKGGFCRNEKITEDFGEHGADMLVYPYNEGVDYFWTGPDFGCVLHVS